MYMYMYMPMMHSNCCIDIRVVIYSLTNLSVALSEGISVGPYSLSN